MYIKHALTYTQLLELLTACDLGRPTEAVSQQRLRIL